MHKLQEELEASKVKVSALKEALAVSNAENASLKEQLDELRMFNFLLRKEVTQLNQQVTSGNSRRHSVDYPATKTEACHAPHHQHRLSEPDHSTVHRRSRKSATTKHAALLNFTEARRVNGTPTKKPKAHKRGHVGKYVPSFMRKAR